MKTLHGFDVFERRKAIELTAQICANYVNGIYLDQIYLTSKFFIALYFWVNVDSHKYVIHING